MKAFAAGWLAPVCLGCGTAEIECPCRSISREAVFLGPSAPPLGPRVAGRRRCCSLHCGQGNPAGRGGVLGACRDRVRAGHAGCVCGSVILARPCPLTGSPGVLWFHTHGWLFRSVRRPSPHPRAPRLDRRSQPAPRCLDAPAMRRAGRKCNDAAPVG